MKGSTYKPNKVFIQRINEAEFLGETIRMGTGELSPSLLPVKKTNQILSSLTLSSEHLGYEEAKGSYPLRVAICKYIRKSGVNASPDSVLIVSGALQAFQLIANGLLKEKSSILVESPSYLFLLNVFQSAKMNLIDVPISKIKNQVSILKTLKAQHQANLLYTIPTFHNPTGMTYSTEERKGIVDICRSNQLPIIEDDVYRELWIDSPPPQAMKSMDQTGNILYLGSASKILSPGLRIGWIVGPEVVVNQLADLKMQMDYGACSFSQAVLEKWFTNEDMCEEHVYHIRSELKQRRD